MLFFLVYILFVIICPSTVANVLIYFSQVLMLPSYRTILVYRFLLVSFLCCAKRNVGSILQKYFQKSILKILFYFVF